MVKQKYMVKKKKNRQIHYLFVYVYACHVEVRITCRRNFLPYSKWVPGDRVQVTRPGDKTPLLDETFHSPLWVNFD